MVGVDVRAGGGGGAGEYHGQKGGLKGGQNGCQVEGQKGDVVVVGKVTKGNVIWSEVINHGLNQSW